MKENAFLKEIETEFKSLIFLDKGKRKHLDFDDKSYIHSLSDRTIGIYNNWQSKNRSASEREDVLHGISFLFITVYQTVYQKNLPPIFLKNEPIWSSKNDRKECYTKINLSFLMTASINVLIKRFKLNPKSTLKEEIRTKFIERLQAKKFVLDERMVMEEVSRILPKP